MFKIIDNKLYRCYGFWSLDTVGTIIEKASEHSIFKSELVFIEEIDLPNGFYRKRRNKYVKIPDEFLGIIPTKRTIRQRNNVSRRTRKEHK